jgi:hypothetical protein
MDWFESGDGFRSCRKTRSVAGPLAVATAGYLLQIAIPAHQQALAAGLCGKFSWKLNDWQAVRIAERIETLVPTECKSGSDIIEVGSEGEIPVKVSRDEFTGDFLVARR